MTDAPKNAHWTNVCSAVEFQTSNRVITSAPPLAWNDSTTLLRRPVVTSRAGACCDWESMNHRAGWGGLSVETTPLINTADRRPWRRTSSSAPPPPPLLLRALPRSSLEAGNHILNTLNFSDVPLAKICPTALIKKEKKVDITLWSGAGFYQHKQAGPIWLNISLRAIIWMNMEEQHWPYAAQLMQKCEFHFVVFKYVLLHFVMQGMFTHVFWVVCMQSASIIFLFYTSALYRDDPSHMYCLLQHYRRISKAQHFLIGYLRNKAQLPISWLLLNII